jgi:hypothetical protein
VLKVKRRSFIIALWVGALWVGLGCGGFVSLKSLSHASYEEPYHAHPEMTYNGILLRIATHLYTEGLAQLSEIYQNIHPQNQRVYLDLLLRDPEFLSRIPEQHQTPLGLRHGLSRWHERYPLATLVTYLETDDLLERAHFLLGLAQIRAGERLPQTSQDLLDGIFQRKSFSARQKSTQNWKAAALAFCEGNPEQVTHVMEGVPRAKRYMGSIYSRSPFTRAIISRFLLNGKTCLTLIEDVFDIVSPHENPYSGTLGRRGQLEGVTSSLARFYFSDRTLNPTQLQESLLDLRKIYSLNPRLDLWQAVEEVTPLLNERSRIQLLASASHNHGLEFYLVRMAIGLRWNSGAQAVQQGKDLFRSINHLYGLIAKHQKERRFLGARDVLTQAPRPYHFWGAAFLSCEIKLRGYTEFISKNISLEAGRFYEQETSGQTDTRAADVLLHKKGSAFGAEICNS